MQLIQQSIRYAIYQCATEIPEAGIFGYGI
jgi:hypothetical protein